MGDRGESQRVRGGVLLEEGLDSPPRHARKKDVAKRCTSGKDESKLSASRAHRGRYQASPPQRKIGCAKRSRR